MFVFVLCVTICSLEQIVFPLYLHIPVRGVNIALFSRAFHAIIQLGSCHFSGGVKARQISLLKSRGLVEPKGSSSGKIFVFFL